MKMTRRQLLWMSVSALPLGAKGVLDWQRDNLLIADSLQRSRAVARLLLVQPTVSKNPAGPHFHAYPVTAQASLSAADRAELIAALVESLRAYSITDGVSANFTPRYGLRLENKAGVEADLLISFQTNQLYYFTSGRPRQGRLRGGEARFQRVARALGLH